MTGLTRDPDGGQEERGNRVPPRPAPPKEPPPPKPKPNG